MAEDNRQNQIERFQEDDKVKVCLLSMLGNGEGITLTAGNHMIMVDKWWNKAKEEQVKSRIDRIG